MIFTKLRYGGTAALALVAAVGLGISQAQADLVVHLDATDIVRGGAEPADGTNLQPLGGWDDLASTAGFNDFDGSSGSSWPEYKNNASDNINGNPVVKYAFGGHNVQTGGNAGITDAGGLSIFMVGNFDNWSSIFRFNDLSQNSPNLEGFAFEKTGNDISLAAGFGKNITMGFSSFIDQDVIIEVQYLGGGWDASNVLAFVNGTATTLTNNGADNSTLNFSNEFMRLGGGFFDFGELQLYNSSLGEAERNAVGLALSEKWGIESTYIPEPASAGLLAMGLGLILARRR